MKITDLIKVLRYIHDSQGEIEVQLQNDPGPGDTPVTCFPHFFICEEPYEDGIGMIVNIRTWPY